MMTIQLTGPAEDYLREYLDRVRRSLGSGVEAADVEAGIREHIDTELASRSLDRAAEPATREDIALVIERLGPPESWDERGAENDALLSGPAPMGQPPRSASHRLLPLLGFGLILLGLALAFTARWGGLGWLLIAGGSVTVRAAAPATGTDAADRLLELADGWWRGFTFVAALGLLLAPAVLSWASAQIGGVLEAPLSAWLGADAGSPGARSISYWLGVAAVAAFASGGWWVLVGGLVRRYRAVLERALGSARRLVEPARAKRLMLAGIVLFVISFAGLLL